MAVLKIDKETACIVNVSSQPSEQKIMAAECEAKRDGQEHTVQFTPLQSILL